MLHAVIMAGGSGTRFWPLSRQALPKQFLTLAGERSLIQSAFDRCQPMILGDRFWVVTNESMIETTADHLPELPKAHLIPEPCGRNTAPCVGLAALLLAEEDPEAIMLVMPADHVISSIESFQEAVLNAVNVVRKDPEQLVLFGVPPTSPATGYGYIERCKSISNGVYKVASFREKPDRPTAEEYLQQGTFYWNCGIFVWKAQTILDELEKHQPGISTQLKQLQKSINTPAWDSALAECFPKMPSISIDYAVLEKSKKIAVVEAPFDWDDVGSLEAMSRLNSTDENGNTVIGTACLVDSKDNIVRSSDGHTVGLLGIKNCIVVHTPDATLVADRTDENAIRDLVEALKEQGHHNVL